MITLDYRTNNPRWGLCGVNFTNWENYCLTLGFLSNINHHNITAHNGSIWNNSISIHVEQNNRQGAWDAEGRIHFYKNINNLQSNLHDLYLCRSAGVGNIQCRINSNGYIQSLITDFGFQIITHAGLSTADIIPPANPISVRQIIENFLLNSSYTVNVDECLNYFDNGFNI